MGKRATCCAHLHPRQACRRDRGARDGVLRQLSVGMMYLLSARVPFSKQSWGSSTWLSCGLVRPLSVSKCDGPPLVTTSSPFSKQSDLKDWRWLQPGFAIFFSIGCSPGVPTSRPGAAARVSTHSSATCSTLLPWEVVQEGATNLFPPSL